MNDLHQSWRSRVGASAESIVVPGFVDIHIHGGFGIDFMSASAAEIRTWCDNLREQGYECFLPTTVTASSDAVRKALTQLPEHEMIAGFHLEGPFISSKYPGAQPQDAIASPLDRNAWKDILSDPRLKVITIAGEIPGALNLIAELSERGVIVSLGHTNATFAECERAYQAGARHTTHTYNAMRPLHHRESGSVGFALLNDDVRCELIYDRIHVCKEAAQVLLKAKPADGVIAISDATMAAGMDPGSKATMWGMDVLVGEKEVRLTDGTLAGSAITLLDAFRNLAEDVGLETAVRACCLNPRKALNLEDIRLLVEFDSTLQVRALHRV